MDSRSSPEDTEAWTGQGTCLQGDIYQVMDSEFNPESLTLKPMFLTAVYERDQPASEEL